MDGFAAAAAQSDARGWPVVVRPSAGLTVAHHGSVLNISRLSLAPESGGPYEALLVLLEGTCARLGLTANHGAVPGAYCDGAHNLRIGGRKVAGLSARLIPRQGRRGLLAHACLTVAGEVARDVAAVRDFERALGLPVDYSAAAHCSLESCLSNCEA
jgi:lipoate-protein ligase A